MPRKSFRVAAAVEPISFDLEGSLSGLRNFECRDRLAAGTLMRFAETFSAMEETDDEAANAKQGVNAIPAIREFFDRCLKPEGRPRFWQMINDDDEGIPLDTLVEIAGWLSEVYSGERPTGATSSPTSAGILSGEGSPAMPPPVAMPTYSRPEPMPSSI